MSLYSGVLLSSSHRRSSLSGLGSGTYSGLGSMTALVVVPPMLDSSGSGSSSIVKHDGVGLVIVSCPFLQSMAGLTFQSQGKPKMMSSAPRLVTRYSSSCGRFWSMVDSRHAECVIFPASLGVPSMLYRVIG